jgi:hypothetical protein
MNSAEQKYITREDVESLAEKLDALAHTLSSAERTLLGLAVTYAADAATGQGVRAHTLSTPLATRLALAAKFAPDHMLVPNIPKINPGKLRAKDPETPRVSFRAAPE